MFGKKKKQVVEERTTEESVKPEKVVLVIDYDKRPWVDVFENSRTEKGEKIKIHQACWDQLSVSSDSLSKPLVHIKPGKNATPGSGEDGE